MISVLLGILLFSLGVNEYVYGSKSYKYIFKKDNRLDLFLILGGIICMVCGCYIIHK